MNFTTLWTDTFSTLEKVILAIAIGILIAGIMLIYNRRVTARPIRALLKAEALTPGTAKTAAELGLKPSAFRPVRDPYGGMRRSVRVILADGTEADGKLTAEDLGTARYYLPDDLKYAAEVRYDAKHTAWPVMIVVVIAVLIAAYLCIKYIPQLLDLKLFD